MTHTHRENSVVKSGLTSAVECSEAESVTEFIGDKSDSGLVGPGGERVRSGSHTDRLSASLLDRQSVSDVTTRLCSCCVRG